jgi:hypothetical protein
MTQALEHTRSDGPGEATAVVCISDYPKSSLDYHIISACLKSCDCPAVVAVAIDRFVIEVMNDSEVAINKTQCFQFIEQVKCVLRIHIRRLHLRMRGEKVVAARF